jgi:uncharacterized protein involved in type VI secretion and phage assembly
MSNSLLELLSLQEEKEFNGKIYGVATGIIVDIKDPENRGRVKVNFPWMCQEDSLRNVGEEGVRTDSYWARVATLMAGANRGSYFIPEVGDEVLVAFHHGDINRPYVIGAIWNGDDQPPEDMDGEGKNNFRTIESRSGHIIRFDDTRDKERIIIMSNRENRKGSGSPKAKNVKGHRIILDDTKGKEKIEIYDHKGENFLEIDSAKNKITIKTDKGDISLSAPIGKISLEANQIEIKSKTSAKIESGTNLDVKSNAPMNFESKATLEIKANAILTLKGSLIKIN